VAAHPAGLLRGNALHERVVGHVLRDDRARGDECVAADRVSADDRGVRADRRASPNHVLLVERMPVHLRAWVRDVRKDAGRAEEDVIPRTIVPVYTETLFWILTLFPRTTSFAMFTFWPRIQPLPIFAPFCT